VVYWCTSTAISLSIISMPVAKSRGEIASYGFLRCKPDDLKHQNRWAYAFSINRTLVDFICMISCLRQLQILDDKKREEILFRTVCCLDVGARLNLESPLQVIRYI
jgi:hypothetical protein